MDFKSPLHASWCLAVALALCAGGCGDGSTDEIGDDETSDDTGDGDGDAGDGDGDTGDGDGDGDTGDGDGDGDGDKPELGATPNVLCEASLAGLAEIVAENDKADPDPAVIEAAYVGAGLQEFVQLAGVTTGRVEEGVLIDDAAILASIQLALDVGDPQDMLDVEWRIYLVMQQYIRHEITDVSETLPDPANDPALLYARWDAAWCYWDGGLRPLAQLADGYAPEGYGVEADIDAGFEWGHDGIEGAEPWAIDEWAVGPAKQQVEKSHYNFAHRLVAQWAADAATEADPDAAALIAWEALGAFQIIEDRMASKNTPGITIIEDMLSGDPAQIDPEGVVREMSVAFAKRTRKYTDYALPDVGALLGTAEGYKGAVEGRTYSRLIEPWMIESLDGFDPVGYAAAWEAWIAAIEADDLAAAEAASAELTDWNCQFQAALGIAECTSSVDE